MIHTIEEAISRLRYVQLDNEFSPRDIVHMILAGGSSQVLYNIHKGGFEPAIEFLCQGTRDITSYRIPGGIVREEQGRPFFRKGVDKSFPASEYLNEFLGTLAYAGIHFPGTGIVTNRGTEASLADMADEAMERYSLSEEEQSWSLQLFSVYPGITKEWKNSNGELQSAERILSHVIRQPYGAGSSFGTNALTSVSFAVSRFCLEQDVEPSQLEGVWKDAYAYVSGAVSLMRKNQRDDGSLDHAWFRQKSFPRGRSEWSEMLRYYALRRSSPGNAIVYPTGHCLDAISPLAMFLATGQDWIASATYIVAQTIEMQWIQVVPDITSVTRAIHALKLIGD